MAKSRVTEKSLRVGQTVWQVYWCVIGEEFDYCEINICNLSTDWAYIEYWKLKTEKVLHKLKLKTPTCFYSKSKAKTKMNKLNRGFEKELRDESI